MAAAAQARDPAAESDNNYRREPEPEKIEMEVPPPAFPKPENLVRFLSDGTINRVFLDRSSIKLGSDGVLLYTLVVRGSGGGENVTFEGMRCGSAERRVYAYGRRDGTWAPARNINWIRIVDSTVNRYHFELYRDVFCDVSATEPVSVILQNLKSSGRQRDYTLPN